MRGLHPGSQGACSSTKRLRSGSNPQHLDWPGKTTQVVCTSSYLHLQDHRKINNSYRLVLWCSHKDTWGTVTHVKMAVITCRYMSSNKYHLIASTICLSWPVWSPFICVSQLAHCRHTLIKIISEVVLQLRCRFHLDDPEPVFWVNISFLLLKVT